MDKQEFIRKTAEEFLDHHCDSLPAWLPARKELAINAMIDFAKQLPELISRHVMCACKYPVKKKGYNRCSICGGKIK